ncbi:MAG: shikimate kinase [Balneolaceae bacterium]
MSELTLSKPIFLCGMMGSGKSTIGKRLAARLNVPFRDLDKLITQQESMSIPGIFSQKGEDYFRETERNLLIKECERTKGVMALGGGSLQNQQVVDHLKLVGRLVFLKVPQSVLLKRLKSGRNRPMLSETNIEQKINQLLTERNPFYEQAEITISIGTESHNRVVDNLVKKLSVYEG